MREPVFTLKRDGLTLLAFIDDEPALPVETDPDCFLWWDTWQSVGGSAPLIDVSSRIPWGYGQWALYEESIPEELKEEETNEHKINTWSLYQIYLRRKRTDYKVWPLEVVTDRHTIIRVGDFEDFNQRWHPDGYVVVRMGDEPLEMLALFAHMSVEEKRDRVVELHNDWLKGSSYWWSVCEKDGSTEIDSLWGYSNLDFCKEEGEKALCRILSTRRRDAK